MTRLVVKKQFEINRMDTLQNRSPDGDTKQQPTTPGHETRRRANRFDSEFNVVARAATTTCGGCAF
jgi:hypothetical protein